MIPTPVYVEKLHDLRQMFTDKFDADMIRGFLVSKGIKIEAFETRHAEHVAALIGTIYPTTKEWRAFKRDRCLRCVGLVDFAGQVKRSGKACGATLDWLVAGHADADAYLLVTNDRGAEFREVKYKAKIESVCDVANDLLRTLKGPSHLGGN